MVVEGGGVYSQKGGRKKVRGCTGWIMAELFYEYIGYLWEHNIQFAIILFVSDCTHLTYQVSQFCSELG